MNKPVPFTRQPLMDYHQMRDFVEQKHGIQVRDYKGLFGSQDNESHFTKYQRITGDMQPNDRHYPDVSNGHTVVRRGKRRKATKQEYDADFKLIHEQYQRYKDWSEDNPSPPYLDYWHWLLENCFYNLHNGSEQYFDVTYILDDEDNPPWVKEITQLFHDEFKDQLDEDGGIAVWIEW